MENVMPRTLKETRDQVTPGEVMDAWENLYGESGPPTVDDIVSLLGTHREAVVQAWPAGELVVGVEDDVVNHESDDVDDKAVLVRPPIDSPIDDGYHDEHDEEAEAAEEEERQRDYMADMKMDSRRMGEGVQEFDKFMDKILISEGHGSKPVPPEDNPQRRRAAQHQDRPNNKIRYGVK